MTLSSTKDHKYTFRLLFPDRQNQCMPRTEDHKRAFPRVSPLDRTGVCQSQKIIINAHFPAYVTTLQKFTNAHLAAFPH